MFDSSRDICKSLKTSIGVKTKNSEMLKFIPDHLKTKKMCKNTVKKLPLVIRFVPDRYKTQVCMTKLFQKMVEC